MTRRFISLFLVLLTLPASLALAQKAQPEPPPPTAEVRSAMVDSVRSALLTYYVFPDAGKSMAAHLERQLRAGAYDTVVTGNALAAAITRDLSTVQKDAHLRIAYDPEEARRIADTSVHESHDNLPRDRKNNFNFRTARILPGNIGYLEFTQFAEPNAESRRVVRAAMQFVANTDALILDLRENRGGSAEMGNEIASYFVNSRAHWSDSYNRLTDKWTEGWIENRPEITGGIQLAMPVTVLTSNWTFSAAEGLAYGLKYGRQARIVGQSSAGGAHVLRRVDLGNGFVGFIPYIRSANTVTKTDWEGTGVTPDVPADKPNALLKAQEAIFAGRLAATKDSAQIGAINWAINEARAVSLDVDVPVNLLDQYAGRFEEYAFSVKGNRLYSVNKSRNDKTDKLTAITQMLFQIDQESQVEFVRGAGGAVNSIRLLWNDGFVDTIARAK
ncbi:MAG TPA: S41 family peptidase [Thermoanaerobaculia bacterium]|jgi:hypothetical protein|nr:S41 family peptidase [Thermoanaerobaculia bacterium]